MTSLLRTLALATAIAAGTWFLGWWTVPAIAAAWAFLSPEPRSAAREAGLASLVAWAALLALTATGGPVDAVATRVAAIMQLPTVGFYALTLLFPFLLGWSMAATALLLRRTSRRGDASDRERAGAVSAPADAGPRAPTRDPATTAR